MARVSKSPDAVEIVPGNEQNKNEKPTKKIAPAKNGASTRKASLARERVAAEKAIQDPDAAEVTEKNTPDWASWSKRYTVTLQNAIYTVHNIVANEKIFMKLKEKGDPRTKKYANHLKTLKDWVRNAPHMLPKENPDKEKAVTEKTRILLGHFVEWVREESPFPDLEIPPQFFALSPPTPKTLRVEDSLPEIRSINAQATPQKYSDSERERLNKTWARLVVLMAVEHYGFMPDWPPNKLKKPKSVQGVYGPLARLSEEVGVDLLKDRSTVSSAFIAAVETMGKDAVGKIRQTALEREKSAQSASKGKALESGISNVEKHFSQFKQ